MNPNLKIGVAGLGTVGSGLVKLIMERRDELELRAGRKIEISAISARDKNLDRDTELKFANKNLRVGRPGGWGKNGGTSPVETSKN